MSVSLLPILDQWNVYVATMSTLGTAGAVLSVVGALVLLAGAVLKSSGSIAGSFALWGPGLLVTLLAAVGNQWLPLIIGAISVTAAAVGSSVVAILSIGDHPRHLRLVAERPPTLLDR